jgi:hypothetical protein
MPENAPKKGCSLMPGIDLAEEDILEAMKLIPGYLDITPLDLVAGPRIELGTRGFSVIISRVRESANTHG